jgi:hypothetical protein
MGTPESMHASKPDLVPNSGGRLLRFPSPPREKTTRPESDTAHAYLKETADFCADAHSTLKEVRYRVIQKLIYTLGLLDLDTRTLTRLLDVGPSVLEDLITGETDAITTETLLKYLDRLAH